MGKYAWVTLATNDSYSLGALVVAYSLKRVHTAHQLAVLVTVGVSDAMKTKLSNVFDLVEEVNVLDSHDSAHLALLSRPELGVTFTKLHCWRLTQYEKCVFLDADTLILLNCDELFEREELSAAPDVGWPDCFNTGVFVYRPSVETYNNLLEYATQNGSFDGGDQGLLNSFFSDWATKDIAKHLPFLYNTTTTAIYSYIPAFKQFGTNVKILHFIGSIKPWLQIFDSASKTVQTPSGYGHVTQFLQLWWNIFCDDVHPKLSPEMNNTRTSFGQGMDSIPWYEKPPNTIRNNPPNFNLEPAPIPNNINPIEQLSYYDPWEAFNQNNNQNDNNSTNQCIELNISYENNIHINNNQNSDTYQEYNYNNISTKDNEVPTQVPSTSFPQSFNEQNNNVHVPFANYLPSNEYNNINNKSINNINTSNNMREIQVSNEPHTDLIHKSNVHVSSNSNLSEQQNDKNQKNDYDAMEQNDTTVDEATNIESGIAGALAQLKLGEVCSNEQDNYMRRQCWESGNIDYLGKDSFDNIWRRISQTLECGPKLDYPQAPPQRDSTPQRESTPQPEEKLTSKVDAQKKEVTLRLTTTFEEKEEEHTRSERNVIAVCSPHELMRSLSSPGLAEEQIITTVTAEGKTVTQKVLTYPEREIQIEDYETIEILGPVTRKVTTETTRVTPGKADDTQVVVHTTQSQPGSVSEPQREITVKTKVGEVTPAPAKNQLKPESANKIPLSAILTPQPNDKVEFDEKTNTTTITRKTSTGYEMIIGTVTPDGRNRVQTKTFFNPVEIRGDEEEEEYEEQHVTDHGTKKTTTTTTSTTTGVVKKPAETAPPPKKVDDKTTSTTKTTKTDAAKTDVKSTTTTQVATLTKPKGEDKTTITIEKTPTGHKEIHTTITAEGITKVQTKTFYDPVDIPGDEEEIEEYEESHTTSPVKTTKTTTTTKGAVPLPAVASKTVEDTKKTTTTTTTTKDVAAKKVTDDKKVVQKVDKVATAVPAKIDEEKQTKITKVDSSKAKSTKEDTITKKAVEEVATKVATKTTTESTKTTVTKTTEATVAAKKTVADKTTTDKTATTKAIDTTAAKKTTAVDSKDKKSTTTGAAKDKITTTKTTTAAAVPAKGEPKTIVTTKRVANGTEKTITTINPDGTKKVESKTVFDTVELSGSEEEEEEYEEYEEEIEEPVKTKKTTTTTTIPAKTITTATTPKPAAAKTTTTPAPKAAAPKAPTPVAEVASPAKKKLGSAVASPNGASSTTKPATSTTTETKELPVPPPRKKEVKKVITPKTTTPLKK